MATEYTVTDERGCSFATQNAELADRFSRAGRRVTARTGGEA